MVEIVVLSLLTASLGLLVASVLSWLGWQQKRLQQEWEEEEILTQYESKDNVPPSDSPSPQAPGSDLSPRPSGWEFKILRANRNVFRNPAVLKRICQEEAEAGWILLEKLDERRLRFKRPMSLRDRLSPETLKRDPYRSRYGSPLNFANVFVVLALLFALVLPAYLGYTLVHQTLIRNREDILSPPQPQPSPTLPPLQDSF
jgi:hypothetical protein